MNRCHLLRVRDNARGTQRLASLVDDLGSVAVLSESASATEDPDPSRARRISVSTAAAACAAASFAAAACAFAAFAAAAFSLAVCRFGFGSGAGLETGAALDREARPAGAAGSGTPSTGTPSTGTPSPSASERFAVFAPRGDAGGEDSRLAGFVRSGSPRFVGATAGGRDAPLGDAAASSPAAASSSDAPSASSLETSGAGAASPRRRGAGSLSASSPSPPSCLRHKPRRRTRRVRYPRVRRAAARSRAGGGGAAVQQRLDGERRACRLVGKRGVPERSGAEQGRRQRQVGGPERARRQRGRQKQRVRGSPGAHRRGHARLEHTGPGPDARRREKRARRGFRSRSVGERADAGGEHRASARDDRLQRVLRGFAPCVGGGADAAASEPPSAIHQTAGGEVRVHLIRAGATPRAARTARVWPSERWLL